MIEDTSPEKYTAAESSDDEDDDDTSYTDKKSDPKDAKDSREDDRERSADAPEKDKKEKETTESEKLEPEETQLAALEYVENRSEEVVQELESSTTDSEEEAAALASAVYMEAIRERISDNEAEVDEALLEEAELEAVGDLELSEETAVDTENPPMEAVITAPEAEVSEASETPEEQIVLDTPSEDEFTVDESTEQVVQNLAEETNEDQEDEPPIEPTPATPQPPVPTPPPIPTPIPTPPIPPIPPTPPVPPIPPPPTPSGPGGLASPPPQGPNTYFGTPPPFAINTAPMPTPNVITPPRQAEEDESYYRSKRKRDLLTGLVVGYLIGRRRGRIKTENRLMPVQEKLEKQVRELHDSIAIREERIRELARQEVRKNPEKAHVFVQKLEVRQQKIEFRRKEARSEWLSSRPSVEKIGLLSATKSEIGLERRQITGEENAPSRRPVEIMTVDELLVYAEKITWQKEDVKRLFEAGRIDQNILRQVVKEFLRSGPFEKTLFENVKPDPAELAKHHDQIAVAHYEQSPTEHLSRSDTLRDLPQELVSTPVIQEARHASSSQKQPQQMIKAGAALGVALGIGLVLWLLISG